MDEEKEKVRLKPRLTMPQPDAEPAAELPAAVASVPVVPAPPVPAAAVARPEPPPAESLAVDRPAVKFSLKPKALAGVPTEEPEPVPVMPAPEPSPVPPEFTAPPMPAPAMPTSEDEGEPAEITAIHQASAVPFPPPPGNFPAPTRVASLPPPPWAKGESTRAAKKKKIFLIGSGIVVAVGLLGGAFFTYSKFTEAPPPPPKPKPKLKLPAKPVPPTASVAVEPGQPVLSPTSIDAVGANAPTKNSVPVALSVPAVVPPPPSVASQAFKGWVENLKISGIRAGSSPRIFIDGATYGTGDLVNPQLGITFAGYDPETRMLIFKDQSGATVERRN